MKKNEKVKARLRKYRQRKKKNDRKKTSYSDKLYVTPLVFGPGNNEKIEIRRKKRKIVRIVRNKGFKKEKMKK